MDRTKVLRRPWARDRRGGGCMFASVNFYVCSEQSFTRESLSNEDIKYPHAFGVMFEKMSLFQLSN
jgi:hypothetical protein